MGKSFPSRVVRKPNGSYYILVKSRLRDRLRLSDYKEVPATIKELDIDGDKTDLLVRLHFDAAVPLEVKEE